MSRNWVFTLNNFTLEQEKILQDFGYFSYIIYGHEIGEKGTPHLQGYFQLVKKLRMQTLKNKLGIAEIHLEAAKGSPEDNINYCKKESTNVYIRGEMKKQGSRTKKFYENIQACDTWEEVLQLDGVERYLRYAREVFDMKPRQKQDESKLEFYTWQKRIIEICKKEPDDRHIYFIEDTEGGKGKTWLCRFLYDNYNAFYCGMSKSQDIYHAYKGERIVLYDIPRCTEQDFVNFGVIEQLKNGIMFSGKYESKTKRYKSPHIFVFSNEDITRDKNGNLRFSKDRIIKVTV